MQCVLSHWASKNLAAPLRDVKNFHLSITFNTHTHTHTHITNQDE